MITIDEAHTIIEQMNREFDFHDFIRAYIIRYPASYLEMLRSFGAVGRANGRIAAFLQEKQRDKNIFIHQTGKVRSMNVFGRETRCEHWIKKL